MKNEVSKAQQVAIRLRKIADWLDKHPQVDPPSFGGNYYSYMNPTTELPLPELIHRIGSCKKEVSNDDIHFVVSFRDESEDGVWTSETNLVFYTKRANVCRRVVVGHEDVPEEIVPQRVIPAYKREIAEWDCEPVLASGDPAPASSSNNES